MIAELVANSEWLGTVSPAAESNAVTSSSAVHTLSSLTQGGLSGLASGAIISLAIWAAIRSLSRITLAAIVLVVLIVVGFFVAHSRWALIGPGSALVLFVNIAVQGMLSFTIATFYLDFRGLSLWYGRFPIARQPMLYNRRYGIADLLIFMAILGLALAVARLFHHDVRTICLDSVAARELFFWSTLDVLNVCCTVPVTMALLSVARPWLVVPVGALALTMVTLVHRQLYALQYEVEMAYSERAQVFCASMNAASVLVHWGTSLILRSGGISLKGAAN